MCFLFTTVGFDILYMIFMNPNYAWIQIKFSSYSIKQSGTIMSSERKCQTDRNCDIFASYLRYNGRIQIRIPCSMLTYEKNRMTRIGKLSK